MCLCHLETEEVSTQHKAEGDRERRYESHQVHLCCQEQLVSLLADEPAETAPQVSSLGCNFFSELCLKVNKKPEEVTLESFLLKPSQGYDWHCRLLNVYKCGIYEFRFLKGCRRAEEVHPRSD